MSWGALGLGLLDVAFFCLAMAATWSAAERWTMAQARTDEERQITRRLVRDMRLVMVVLFCYAAGHIGLAVWSVSSSAGVAGGNSYSVWLIMFATIPCIWRTRRWQQELMELRTQVALPVREVVRS